MWPWKPTPSIGTPSASSESTSSRVATHFATASQPSGPVAPVVVDGTGSPSSNSGISSAPAIIPVSK